VVVVLALLPSRPSAGPRPARPGSLDGHRQGRGRAAGPTHRPARAGAGDRGSIARSRSASSGSRGSPERTRLLALALPAIVLVCRGSGNRPKISRRTGGGLAARSVSWASYCSRIRSPWRCSRLSRPRFPGRPVLDSPAAVALLLLRSQSTGPWRHAVRNVALASIRLPRPLSRGGARGAGPGGRSLRVGRAEHQRDAGPPRPLVDANLPRSATLAVNDIGAIAYFSRRPVLDLMGLVTPEIRPYRREGEAGVLRFVAERCPDFVIIFPTWFPELAARRDLLVPVYRVRLERTKSPVGRKWWCTGSRAVRYDLQVTRVVIAFGLLAGLACWHPRPPSRDLPLYGRQRQLVLCRGARERPTAIPWAGRCRWACANDQATVFGAPGRQAADPGGWDRPEPSGRRGGALRRPAAPPAHGIAVDALEPLDIVRVAAASV